MCMASLAYALALGVPAPHAPAALHRTEEVLVSGTKGWSLEITECPDGQRNAAESECLDAVRKATLKSGAKLQPLLKNVHKADLPHGCSYSKISKGAVFNNNPAARPRNPHPQYQLVCTSIDNVIAPAASQGPTVPTTRGEPRVFVIGPNKAGTTTLSEIFNSMGFHSCHDTCRDGDGDRRARWDNISRAHDASSHIWRRHNAFADHGDHADFKWLDATFPGSRFVLNARALQPWLLSSYDHVRMHRLKAGCTAQGDDESCKKPRHMQSDWLDNSDAWIAERVALAAKHQQDVMEYFDANEERRQRFVVVDVEGWSDDDVMLPLRWVTRSSLDDLPTPTLLAKPGQLRQILGKDVKRADEHLHAVPRRESKQAVATAGISNPIVDDGDSTVVHANPRDHPKESERNVNRALRELVRCPEGLWHEIIYDKCAGNQSE
eukprot:Transcript_3826.p2 GENE.Transcript_3826~~Transcript_3826.p2  ORF type:complete len:464 (-),score=102.93 Transcript_3826:499-1806(-)